MRITKKQGYNRPLIKMSLILNEEHLYQEYDLSVPSTQGPQIRLQVRLVNQYNLWQGDSRPSGSSIVNPQSQFGLVWDFFPLQYPRSSLPYFLQSFLCLLPPLASPLLFPCAMYTVHGITFPIVHSKWSLVFRSVNNSY